jgi:hypothetical protein
LEKLFLKVASEEFAKLQNAPDGIVFPESKNFQLVIARHIAEQFMLNNEKFPLPWTVDLVNIALDSDTVQQAIDRIDHYIKVYNESEGLVRVTENPRFVTKDVILDDVLTYKDPDFEMNPGETKIVEPLDFPGRLFIVKAGKDGEHTLVEELVDGSPLEPFNVTDDNPFNRSPYIEVHKKGDQTFIKAPHHAIDLLIKDTAMNATPPKLNPRDKFIIELGMSKRFEQDRRIPELFYIVKKTVGNGGAVITQVYRGRISSVGREIISEKPILVTADRPFDDSAFINVSIKYGKTIVENVDATEIFKIRDAAMRSDRAAIVHTNAFPGGIDLNTSNGMQWKVSKDGSGVEMTVDPAMIERIRHIGIDWLSPVIFKMTPVTSVWPLVGLQAPVQQESVGV